MALLRQKRQVNMRMGGDKTSEVSLDWSLLFLSMFVCFTTLFLTTGAVRAQKQTWGDNTRSSSCFSSFYLKIDTFKKKKFWLPNSTLAETMVPLQLSVYWRLALFFLTSPLSCFVDIFMNVIFAASCSSNATDATGSFPPSVDINQSWPVDRDADWWMKNEAQNVSNNVKIL